MILPANDPHRDQPITHAGAALESAEGAVVLLHGRGASAEDILGLAQALHHPGLAYLAPDAASHSWYPYSFLAPREHNEPWVFSALRKIEATIALAVAAAGLPLSRIAVCGFSQGACLTTEFAATHPARYGALIAYTGGLIGPPGADLRHEGSLAGTPTFLGSGDPDPHIPWTRVVESAEILRHMGAAVTTERYPGRSHTVSSRELAVGQEMLVDMLT